MVKKMIGVMLILVVTLMVLPGCQRNAAMKHKFKKEMALERMVQIAEDLDLSEEQQVQFDELQNEVISKMDNNKKDREAFKLEMMGELEKDNPDVKLIADKVKVKIDEGTAKLKDGIDMAVEFYDMLNEDQKDALMDKVHKKIEAIKVLQE